MTDWAEKRADFQRDGVVHVPGLLGREQLEAALKAWEWSLANPTPANAPLLKRDGAPLFYNDSFHPRVLDGYRAMLDESPIPEACAQLWGRDPVWFIYEQVFLKEGGDTRRTPWHQDGSYLPMDGEDAAVAWITFDPLAKGDSLEFIRGSHRGPIYNTSAFDPRDDTRPIDDRLPPPRLLAYEAERDRHEIVSWPVEPGDVIFFHFRAMHGGAPTRPGQSRRTLTLRFFGERTHYDPKAAKALPNFPDMATRLKPGDTVRAPGFLQLHPKPQVLGNHDASLGCTAAIEQSRSGIA